MNMKWRRRAIVACLALAAFGAWGFGLRSGLIPGLASRLGATHPSDAIEAASTTAISRLDTVPVQTPGTRTRPPDIQRGTSPGIPGTAPAIATPRADTFQTATPTATATDPAPPTPLPTPARVVLPTPLPSYAQTLTPSAGGRFLRVDQTAQTMTVYEDDRVVRVIPVSTGAPYENSFTPAWRGLVGPFWGKAMFRGTDMWADYIWYLFPGARGSILIHSVPYLRNGEEKVYDRPEVLGVEPASKGCVRISPPDAEWLAAWNPVGVPIEITRYSGVIKPSSDEP
jgi:lipoprotein-anchoring transpeptidase ErfK/SrfK